MTGPHQLHTDPSYPFCSFCEEESDNREGWHSACGSFVHEHDLKPLAEPKPETVRQIMERWNAPYAELRRVAGGSWL